MKKAYKGLIRITCLKKTGCVRKLSTKDVQPTCVDCPEAVAEVVDLEGEPILTIQAPERKTGKQKG